MKLILTSIVLLNLSCISATSAKDVDDRGFTEFRSLTMGDSSEVSRKWGSPKKKSTEKIEDWTFSVLEYPDNRTEVWIDPMTDKVVLKIFFPQPNSRLANLDKVLSSEFMGQSFEKIKKKCPRHDEVIYLDRKNGLFVNSRDIANAQAFAISFSDHKIIELFLKADERGDCRK